MRACEHGAHASCTRGFVRHVLSLSESQSELLFEKDPTATTLRRGTGHAPASTQWQSGKTQNQKTGRTTHSSLGNTEQRGGAEVDLGIDWPLGRCDGDSGRLGVGEEWGWGGETGEEGGDLGAGGPSRALTGPITLNPPCAQPNVTVNHAAKAQPAHSMMSSLTRTRTCEHQPRAGVRRGPGHSHLCTRRGCPASSG